MGFTNIELISDRPLEDWLEDFKRDPFACMAAVERFMGLPAHDYRAIATRNAAGLYVVGKSKSSSAATSGDAAAAACYRR